MHRPVPTYGLDGPTLAELDPDERLWVRRLCFEMDAEDCPQALRRLVQRLADTRRELRETRQDDDIACPSKEAP